MWGYFQWCCFAPVSFVKHNLGVKVTVVWGTPCNNQSFQNSTGGGQRDQTHKTLPHSLHGSSKSCFMLRCTHQLLNLLLYKVIKELESPWHKNLQEKHQLSVEWEMPRPTCPSRNEKKKKCMLVLPKVKGFAPSFHRLWSTFLKSRVLCLPHVESEKMKACPGIPVDRSWSHISPP